MFDLAQCANKFFRTDGRKPGDSNPYADNCFIDAEGSTNGDGNFPTIHISFIHLNHP